MSMYLYLLNIFTLIKWRRNVKILFWFEGFVWDFHFIYSHFTLKSRELEQQDKSNFFYFQSLENGNLTFLFMPVIIVCVCVCVCVSVCEMGICMQA